VKKLGERYELIRRIGAGGMAEVWLAHDVELADRPVAIKIMHKHMLPNEEDVARFVREMRFAAMMSHPNIVTVYTTGTCADGPFLVMEYLKGHDLDRGFPGGDAGHIAAIGRDICSGLAYAHGEGVIHRDIKPGNLFLCESGQVKITDFGVARAVGETTLSSAILVGTFAYMPPERWRGEASAFSSDVWAAGCVLYRLISGQLPRQLPDVADYAAAATRGEPVPDLRDITDAPGWLAGTVMAMLADDPGRRPSAGECVQSLSSGQSLTPPSGLPVGGWRLPGRLGPGRLGPAEPAPGPVIGSSSTDPETTPVVRAAVADTAADRARRPNRAVAAVGGVALLVLAGSIAAWRLTDSPQAPGLAAGGGTPAAANHAAAVVPAASAPSSRSRSGAAATSPPGPAASPATSRATSPAGSRSASLSGSPATSTAGPGSAGASAGTPGASTPAAGTPTPSTPAPSTPAASTPGLVPVPDVTGMNCPQAERVLEGDGFTVSSTHTPPGNTVASESPSGEFPAGSVITIVCGSGK